MRTPLKDTINRLKDKIKEQSISRRKSKEQARYYKEQNQKLRQQVAELRQRLTAQRVAHHHYPAQMMAIAVFIAVHGGSLRVAAAAAAFLAQLFGWSGYGRPSASTVRTWVLRCGLHILKSSKNLQGDMVLIIDESIQIGSEKLLLLLGLPLHKDRSYCQPLTGQDVKVLGMEVQSSWNSAWIVDFLKRTFEAHPNIKVNTVISDRGTSILAALKRLNLIWVSDCTHEMMNVVKKSFKDDAALSALCKEIGSLRRQWALSQWSFLLPPTLRDKDRFLRIFTIVEWTKRMDNYWQKLPREVKKVIGFYRSNKNVINRLNQVRHLVSITAKILKSRGISSVSYQQWLQQVAQYKENQKVWTQAAGKFISSLDAYFQTYLPLAQQQIGGRLLCCSDIIESTFGKYKNKGGVKAISADVLKIPLYHQAIHVDFITQAMSTVKESDLIQWQQQYVCHNFFGIRKMKDKELKSAESMA